MTLSRSLRTAAATLIVAAAVVLLPPAAAQAAGCSGSTGVTVVVDFNELNGGSLSAACVDSGGGKVAATLFESAGYPLTPVTGEAGAVCRVSGYPENSGCVNMPPATAYWSLWWSDGRSGTWSYADAGPASLVIPDGAYVAFAWHQGSGRAAPPDVVAKPRVSPVTPNPTKSTKPKPSPKPTPKATPKPSASATSTSPTASATPSPSATTATPTEAASTSAVPTDVPSQTTTTGLPSIDEITDGPETASADADRNDDGGGFPAWLGIGLVVVVLGAAGAVPLIRRRRA